MAADRLFDEAGDYYERARRAESDARALIVPALESARHGLPDFLADSAQARDIIGGVPGLQAEVYQAAALELADRVHEAIRSGRTVVAGQDGRRLEYSDQIRLEDTGNL